MGNLDLYNFVDNHDVERIYTKLSNKAHFAPVHVLPIHFRVYQVSITVLSSVLKERKRNSPMTASDRLWISKTMQMQYRRIHVQP